MLFRVPCFSLSELHQKSSHSLLAQLVTLYGSVYRSRDYLGLKAPHSKGTLGPKYEMIRYRDPSGDVGSIGSYNFAGPKAKTLKPLTPSSLAPNRKQPQP